MAVHTCLLSVDYKCLNLTPGTQKMSWAWKTSLTRRPTSPRPAHHLRILWFQSSLRSTGKRSLCMVLIPFLPWYICKFYKVLNNISGAYFHLKKETQIFFFVFNPESGLASKLDESHWNSLSVMTELGEAPYKQGSHRPWTRIFGSVGWVWFFCCCFVSFCFW